MVLSCFLSSLCARTCLSGVARNLRPECHAHFEADGASEPLVYLKGYLKVEQSNSTVSWPYPRPEPISHTMCTLPNRDIRIVAAVSSDGGRFRHILCGWSHRDRGPPCRWRDGPLCSVLRCPALPCHALRCCPAPQQRSAAAAKQEQHLLLLRGALHSLPMPYPVLPLSAAPMSLACTTVCCSAQPYMARRAPPAQPRPALHCSAGVHPSACPPPPPPALMAAGPGVQDRLAGATALCRNAGLCCSFIACLATRVPIATGVGGHTMPHAAQPQHTNRWAPRTRKRHQQEHRPQRPTEHSDPTQHAKGRTGDCPGPRKGATTRRNVTQGDVPSICSVNCDRKFRTQCRVVHVFLAIRGLNEAAL